MLKTCVLLTKSLFKLTTLSYHRHFFVRMSLMFFTEWCHFKGAAMHKTASLHNGKVIGGRNRITQEKVM